MGVLRFFSIFLKAYKKSDACAKTPQANLMAKWSLLSFSAKASAAQKL